MSEVKFKACDLRASAIVVQEHDFDRVTAERDAALGREAALNRQISNQAETIKQLSGRYGPIAEALQQRLTAADEREDALGSLVPEAELALKALNVAVSVFDVELADSARRGLRLIIASLKSAEGGGDDSAHDRAYRNGLMQGYNLEINGSEKEYQEAVSRYSGGKDAE